MPGKISEEGICQSVLTFVTDGTYPSSEKIIAAEFPVSALSKELELISKAREQVEAEINSLSRENNFDADGWISQAKQLHADIERSRVTAREIVKQHENTTPLQLKVEDAAAKVGLIETEIAFNQAVTSALEEVQGLCRQLEDGRSALGEGRIMAVIDTLEAAELAMRQNDHFANTNVLHILLENVAGLRKQVVDVILSQWNEQLKIERREGKLTAQKDGDRLEETIAALNRMEIFVTARDKFAKDIMIALLDPILMRGVDGQSRGILISESSVQVESQASKTSVPEVLGHISNLLGFLRQAVPTSVVDSFSDSLIPSLSSKMIKSWLSPSIPIELGGLQDFEHTLDCVLKFTKSVEDLGWHGYEELTSWVNQASRLWLAKRRVNSLDQVRKVLAASQGSTKQVEKVEVEVVSEQDDTLLENAPADDWDASWDDDNAGETEGKVSKSQDDEEDVSAWGLDDDDTEEQNSKSQVGAPAEDDAGDAWGWGDDDDDDQNVNQPQPGKSQASQHANGKSARQPTSSREITLTERYTITDIPHSIVDIIKQQIVDSRAINQPEHSHSRVVSSGTGLLALPTLILAMFKATASSFYDHKLNAGQMYLYNDTQYLAGEIRTIMEAHQLTRLQGDIDAVERFGKLAYSKEMQTQRTIVTDLLDGAQGFSQCSEQPYLSECENAVAATVDRIRGVYAEWQPILSHSALLQSIGSLVSTVISKMIIEIEDLGDISEPQSQRLVSFCNQVSKLEELFMPEAKDNTERVPMTAVYVPTWLKFQYLINILESSLADIRYLWVEGELRLEFSPEEVIDLIEALFAESEYRRKALADIRRESRGQWR
ncbi:hypothetical protein ASPACDRAFT_111882 [Aspergillus aculeatus ATCC 16872]|uniref:ZW10 C-terminal helical domain-containing protein n=1 Tax=Aspergillus aculeatus (strain ATCC 16872 / CBS 172.66 / WB 5094) TaxID=690307 RepID=A0A1L9X5T5_ASPA1|nr:uncharacterized protein ASPACDRAFT_111882 [Aspergillus aculeatus ATCC 16872]OJK03815.1 hypothetical protein ASPACDRAFT_111882 [Aspergillus aculeatus ATCC 16872]